MLGAPLAACSSGDGDGAAPATETTLTGVAGELAAARAALAPVAEDQELPPQDLTSIRRVYDEALATMGLRLTRAALIDLSGGRYEPSPDGRHLAMYAEPIGDQTAEGYAEDFWTLSALVTPDVFERWPMLESYDICQEPLPSVDDSPEPPPVTQINITREAAADVDWDGGTLVDLLIAARQTRDVRVIANADVRRTPVYEAANAAAREVTGGSGLTLPPRDAGGGTTLPAG